MQSDRNSVAGAAAKNLKGFRNFFREEQAALPGQKNGNVLHVAAQTEDGAVERE